MKTFFIMLLLIAAHLAGHTQNIIGAEYFIDADKGVGNNTTISVTSAADGSFPFTANLAGVAQGYHTLFIRTKDETGNWSLTARKNIEVIATLQNTIAKGEYFFDEDPGFDNGAAIGIATPDSLLAQNFTATLSGLAAGDHKMYLRTKDANGHWGITSRYNVEVVKDETGGKVFLVEYFFDTDPGFGNCASAVFATSAADGTFTFTIPTSNLPANPVSLFLRVKDSSNYNWSLTQWQSYAVLPLTLLSFTAQKQNSMAQLAWKTTNEVNTSYFNMQRSIDGVQFITVGKVTAKSNGASQTDYGFADDISTLANGTVYYRLQMIDKDGKISYSSIVSITIDRNDIRIVIYPNPAHRFFIVDHLPAESKAYISVTDLAGRILIAQQATGLASQKINISMLTKGMYVVNITTNHHTEKRKLVIE